MLYHTSSKATYQHFLKRYSTMKQKNTKLIIYAALIALLVAIFYLSIHQITPVSEHIEQDISANIH